MPVDNSSASATASALGAAALNTASTPKKELAPDDFITLFLAQMKNQNPMSPTDSSAILAQMAQISSISASKSMQDTLNNLSKNVSSALGNTQVLQATQLIGKRVEVPSKLSPYSPTDGLSGSALLPGAASAVTITIKDMAGNVIKTVNNGPSASGGLIDFTWDGIGNDGTKQSTENVYQLAATAVIDGKNVEVPTAGSFKVNSVALNQKDGGVVLNLEQIGGTSMGDIVKFYRGDHHMGMGNIATTGMQAAMSNMDVISNNIANANTGGFKKSTASFADIFPSGNDASGAQIGIGVTLDAVQQNFSPRGLPIHGFARQYGCCRKRIFCIKR